MAKLAGGLSSGFDGSDGDDAALWQAQELMYEAWDTGAKRERIELAKRALEISDLCADAHVLLAEEVAKTLVEARRHYEAGVAAGERALGAQAFERDAGHFWGLLETRPYMRARAGLAECPVGGGRARCGHRPLPGYAAPQPQRQSGSAPCPDVLAARHRRSRRPGGTARRL